MKCEEEKSRIKNEIINLQKELADIKSKIRERSKMDRHDMSLIIKGNNNSDLYKDLNEEQKEEKKKQIMEEKIDKFRKKNERLLKTEANEEENNEQKNKNNKKK